jgi:hypothetical protein
MGWSKKNCSVNSALEWMTRPRGHWSDLKSSWARPRTVSARSTDIETAAYYSSVKEEDLIEWRKRTVIAAGKIQTQNSASFKLKELIRESMCPVVTPVVDASSREQLRNNLDAELLNLAEKAVSLKLFFRQNTTSYVCEVLDSGTSADDSDDSDMEIIKIRNGNDPSIAKVNYTVHGALIKMRPRTAIEEESRDVLMKAEVVCYAIRN